MVTKYDVMPITYLNGVLLGLNAINDAYLWVDSPDCFFFKVDYIFGNHDLNSTIKQSDGNHRFKSTISNVNTIISNNNNKFINEISDLITRDFVKIVFVTSMPMNQIVGVDYESIINEVKLNTQKPIFNIPSKSMTSCWLDGYEDLLLSLAKNIDISGANPSKKKIGIVGNLFDRNEGDCIGNIEELKNIFEGLGLEIVSIWLDGGNYDDILKIKDAGVIVSLPYGRKAAKKIAKRLEVDLLELDLPFGINNTIEFIKQIGKYFEIKDKNIKDFIDKELKVRNDIGIVKWIIHKFLINKDILYYGDPYLLNGIIDICDTFGLNLKQIFIHGEEKHLKNNIESKHTGYIDIISTDLLKIKNENIDIFIINNASTSSWILEGVGSDNYYKKKILDFGFPSYDYHCFSQQPFYGIKGTINIVNRIYNNLIKQ